jgi:hypothetical protein
MTHNLTRTARITTPTRTEIPTTVQITTRAPTRRSLNMIQRSIRTTRATNPPAVCSPIQRAAILLIPALLAAPIPAPTQVMAVATSVSRLPKPTFRATEHQRRRPAQRALPTTSPLLSGCWRCERAACAGGRWRFGVTV